MGTYCVPGIVLGRFIIPLYRTTLELCLFFSHLTYKKLRLAKGYTVISAYISQTVKKFFLSIFE